MIGNFSETRPYRLAKVALLIFVLFWVSLIILVSVGISGDPSVFILIILLTAFLFWLLIYSPVGLVVVGVQNLLDAGGSSVGGRARFAGIFEEGQHKYSPGKGMYYGWSLYLPWIRIGSMDDRHMLTIAGSRSGKGVGCIIPNLLLWEGSVLCIDPKGTNTHVTAQRRRDMGQDVHILDPFDVVSKDGDSFNVLDILDPDSKTIVEDIGMIADAIIVSEGTKGIHFTESAVAMISGYIAHAITCGDYKNPSLYDVLDMIQLQPEDQDELHGAMIDNEACGGLPKAAALRVLETDGAEEYQSVRATISRNVKWMASPAMRSILTKTTFDIAAMKDTPTSIYLVIPPDMIDQHSRFLRLIINIALSRYARGGKARVPGLFVIDEAPRLGYMKEIATAYGALASYNMVVWTFFQDKGQLDKLYGPEAQSFIGSSRAVQVFGITDKDAKWVADNLGTRTVKAVSEKESASKVMPLRDPVSVAKEVGRGSGKQYILRTGKTPLILELKPYFKDRHLKNLAGQDPDFR